MKWLSMRYIQLTGWRFVGSPPNCPKMVIVGFPHTSNWDFFLFLGALSYFDLKVNFLAKAPLFRGPFGYLMRRWGGIPVDDSGPQSLVDSAIKTFNDRDEMILVVTPEGTRARVESWKTGFWRIAEGADVPVAMAFIDAETKTVGFGPGEKIAGDPVSWIRFAADFYADKGGLRPQNRGPVAF